MVRANFSAYGAYVTDSLHQWDINRTLQVTGLNLSVVPEVHFSNTNMRAAIVRQATMDGGVVRAEIPNSLLQQPLRIIAHIGIYEGSAFRVVETVEIPVIPRKRPQDYEIEDDEEIYSFKRLENEVANMVTRAQFANLVAGVGSDAELVDVRYGADGKTYPSAGEAVRHIWQQIASLARLFGMSTVKTGVNPCDYKGNEICVFNKGLCVGDSLTSGVFNYKDSTGSINNFANHEKYSYPHQLAKLTGIEVTNLAAGGMSSAEWFEAHASDDLTGYDFAIIQLGANDAYEFGGWTTDSSNAYTGIISKLKAQNKNIKIFVSTIIPAANYQTQAMKAVSDGVRNFVAGLNDKDVILLDMAAHGHTNDDAAYNRGHLSALGYAKLAEDYKAYISWYISENKSLFSEVQFIGTDYTYT